MALDTLGVAPETRFEFRFPDGQLSDHESELVDRVGAVFRTVRPSQVFVTRSGDPHPDHRSLARAVRQAVAQTYGSGGAFTGGVSGGPGFGPFGPRPQVFSYRVYPGEGLWPDGRPAQVTARATVVQFARAMLGLAGRRALLFRAPESQPKKMAAINAYDSQSRLLGGELRYVWGKGVELYWPMDQDGSGDALDPVDPSN
jgi:LmbE family N-acetylglucosaminyl deacetylase